MTSAWEERVQGNMLAERAGGKGRKQESGLVGPGSVLGAAAFLSSTRARATVRAAGTCRLAAFGPQELEALLVSPLFFAFSPNLSLISMPSHHHFGTGSVV